jgi:hypothetical protein
MRTGSKIGLTALGVVTAVAMVQAPASASESWHGISGTAYSKATGKYWYYSSNVRTANGGAVKVQFNTLPKGGLAFGIQNYNTGAEIGGIIYAPPLSTQTIAGSVGGGTKFINFFALENWCSGCSPYDFTGSEYY